MAEDKRRVLGYSFALYADQGGDYTHVRLFSGGMGCQRGKAGDLCFRNEEWENLKAGLLTLNGAFR